MAWLTVHDEFTIDDIGARLLANLARGIYNHEAVLREYVQNAGDAYHDLPRVPDDAEINIRIVDDNTVTIQDNGIGMDEQDIKASKRIAVSPKSRQEGRAGFRGIGIWAGFQACSQLEIETSKLGDPFRYRLQIDFEDILQHVNEDINIKVLLDRRFRIHKMAGDRNEHYSRVKLTGLQGEYRKLTDREELQRIASQILPSKIDPQFEHASRVSSYLGGLDGYQEFAILVEGGEVFREFPSGLHPAELVVLQRDGEEYGRAWYCTGDRSITPRGYQYRNFRLRIYNIAVGRAGIFDDEDGSGFGIARKVKLGSSAHLNWHVGEVHITHPDIKPDTPRTSLELDALSRRAIEEIRSFYEDRIAESRARASFNSQRKVMETCDSKLNHAEALELPEAREFLSKLEEQESLLRGRRPTDKVKQFMRGLLSKPEIRSKRKELIRRLQELYGTSADSGPPATTPPISRPTQTPLTPTTEPDSEAALSPTESVNYERLLSDIFAAIQSTIGDDSDLCAEICKAIHNVFEKYGLMDA